MREAMERLAHPEGTFAAGRALAAAFVRVKLAEVCQRLDDVRRVINHDDGAGAGHRARLRERIEIVGQIEHADFLLDVFAVHLALELKFFTRLEHLRR